MYVQSEQKLADALQLRHFLAVFLQAILCHHPTLVLDGLLFASTKQAVRGGVSEDPPFFCSASFQLQIMKTMHV